MNPVPSPAGTGHRYQRVFPGGYSAAFHDWRLFAVLFTAALMGLCAYEFWYGEHGRVHMGQLRAETVRIERENDLLIRQVNQLKAQARPPDGSDFALEKTVRDEMRLARPGEIVYVFDETPENANSLAPVQFDDVVVARKPPEKPKNPTN